MAQDDFEVIRQAWAAVSRGDMPGLLCYLDPGIEIVPFGASMDGRVFRGHEQVRDWWEHEIVPNWKVFEARAEEFRQAGERILVFGRWVARGRTSGVDLDVAATWIIDLRAGKIVRWQTYTDRAEALADLDQT